MTIFSPTRDRNEPDIIKALERVGATVTRLHEPGVPDLLVGWRGATYLLEVKGTLGKRGGSSSVSLTDTQKKWWAKWSGLPPVIVRSVDEALLAIGIVIVAPGMWRDDDGSIRTYPRGQS